MQFHLPSNLQQELLAYDPKLKALAKQRDGKKPTNKAKYPLGKIPYLIPEGVVRFSYQDDAIERINASAAPNRYHRFTKVVDIATPQARTITTAIIYHFEQCWYAAWLPPKGQEDNYVYGYAYGFKDTAAAAKVLPREIWTSKEKCTQHELGRGSIAYTYSACITKEMIVAGDDTRNWRVAGVASYYQKGREIHACVNQFESQLMTTIPTWTDCRSMFDRIKCKSILDALEFPSALTNVIEDRSTFQLTVDDMVSLANTWLSKNNYTSTTYLSIEKIQHIITTPFIKKQLQLMLDKSVAQYNNPDNEHRKYIKYGYKEFEQTTNSIYMIHQIWPDCPVDYYRTYFEELRVTNLNHLRTTTKLVDWLREHMPVSSFFNMMRKYVEQSKKEDKRMSTFSDHEYFIYAWFEMNDTFSMMARIFQDDKQIEAPKRWRMPDFHDYVQAEAWKVTNRKEALHQDLFPAPIKVKVDGSDWTFFQPVDTHQLAQWGQAVRNCVGSAGRYADDIKKRKHFIVLCMIDSKPTFTIQLDVSMGVMNVIQIAGVANQGLSVDQHEQYSTAFKQALQSRESELSSKS
jgi:hypothetical protein